MTAMKPFQNNFNFYLPLFALGNAKERQIILNERD